MPTFLSQSADRPKSVAQALSTYCNELMQPTWRSRELQCPVCEASRFVKTGYDKHKQRFLCSQCGHKFNETTALITKPDKPASANTISLIRSTVLRVLSCGWGGPIPAKSRMNEAEQSAALAFLESLEIDALLQAKDVLEKGLKALGIATSSHKVYRYQFQQWVAWLGKTRLAITSDRKAPAPDKRAAHWNLC